MLRFPMKRLAVSMLLAVLVLTVSGCWNPFAPDPVPPVPIPPPEFRDRLTPEDVLHNLETAYVYKDLDQYLDCLSEDFEFYPDEDDVNDPQNPVPPVWWKIDETIMHTNMFAEDSDVDNITLTLTITSIDYFPGVDPEDPLDDTCECIVDVDLRVNLTNGNGFYASTPSQFDMRIDIDQPNAVPDPDDVLWWEINYWYDLGDRGGSRGDTSSEENIEHISVGMLKNLFR